LIYVVGHGKISGSERRDCGPTTDPTHHPLCGRNGMSEQSTPALPVQQGVDFRYVPGFPGYCVGDNGTVWTCWRGKLPPYLSETWRRMSPYKLRSGRLRVGLYRNRRQHWTAIHRLVLLCFVGPCPDLMECCHFPDRDPTNNALSNLRWDTKKANAADRVAHGTDPRGERHPSHKLTYIQVAEIRRRAASGEKQRQLAAEFAVTQAAISLIVTGHNWSSTLP
jgi:hypothetical protein